MIPPCAARLGVSSLRLFAASIVGVPVLQRALRWVDRADGPPQAGLPRVDCSALAGSHDCSVRLCPDAQYGPEAGADAPLRAGLPRADCSALRLRPAEHLVKGPRLQVDSPLPDSESLAWLEAPFLLGE